jgi:hypothetical protein
MKIQSELTTLMLAWQMARVDGLSQAAAIKKCARRLRNATKDSGMYELLKNLAATTDAKAVECVSRLHDKLMAEGLLYARV